MSTAAKIPPITIQQYEHFAGYPGLRDELINGEIVMSPQPKPLHQQIAKSIVFSLDRALAGSLYTAQLNSNIQFANANSMPAPDVFVVRKHDWKQACETEQYLSVAPILIVEILSPANRKSKVEEKVALYLQQGVACVWVVSPKKRSVAVHRPTGTILLESDAALNLPSPLSGEVMLVDLFRID